MADNKLTDNEIIKALKCCSRNRFCGECENYHNVCEGNATTMIRNALDLINRLQAENKKRQGGYMTQKQEIANLEIEFKAMRGAANSYKAENERLNAKLKSVYKELERIALMTVETDRKELVGEDIAK